METNALITWIRFIGEFHLSSAHPLLKMYGGRYQVFPVWIVVFYASLAIVVPMILLFHKPTRIMKNKIIVDIDEEYREDLWEDVICTKTYGPVVLGLFLLGVFALLGLWFIPQRNRPTIYVGLGGFYIALGLYLLSQANTIFSIVSGSNDGPNDDTLYKIGKTISMAAYWIAAGAAVHLFLGVLISMKFPEPSEYSYILIKIITPDKIILMGMILMGQSLILYGFLRHGQLHRWFTLKEPA